MNNLQYDNVDDRKELFNILKDYMDEKLRKEFLEWCCKQVNTEIGRLLRPGKNSTYHEKEVYWQICSLAFIHGADLNIIMAKAVEVARKGYV